MKSRSVWKALVVATGLSIAVGGAAWAQTVQTTPKAVATPKDKARSQVDGTKLRVEGRVTQVGADWFEIEVLRIDKMTARPAVGSRIRIQRADRLKIWRDGSYLRDGILRVGEKVQIAGIISGDGNAPVYTAKLVKVVQTTP
jgi:hypothetical protein